ncbi:MAG: ATP-binding protein, partial [Pseudobdellovibrionaceae bacterium]
FLQTFFQMKLKNKILHRIYFVFLTLIVGVILLSFVPGTQAVSWTLLGPLIFTSMLMAALTLIYFIWQGRKWAETVAIAWGVAIACNLIWSGYRAGLIEGFWFFGYYIVFGRVLEALILNWVIFQKLRNLSSQVGFAKAKENESVVVKSLLRTLSHDLANTTQLIRTSAQLMAENSNPELTRRNLHHILEATNSQSEIIENAKENYLVRGGQIVNLTAVDLRQSLLKVIENFKPRIEAKNLQLHLEMSEGPLMVFADKTSLQAQVLSNLLNNAIKFTRPGRSIFIEAKNQDPGWVELKIRDEGVGIPSALLDRLFDENENIRRPGTEGELGAGNGLLIIKDFVSAFGAQMKFDSQVEKGTIATLSFKRFK